MKKLLLIILLSLTWSSISITEEKDNSHLQNKFDTYRSCEEHVALVFTWTSDKRVRLDNARVRAYPFVGHRTGIHIGRLNTGEVIFIDSLVYNSWEKEDEWYRSWYSFKVKDDIFYIWKDSVELND